MSQGKIGNINKQTWLDADEKTQKELLFDALEQIYSVQSKQPEVCRGTWEKCDGRIRKLEDKSIRDTGLSGVAGVIGGIIGSYFRSILRF